MYNSYPNVSKCDFVLDIVAVTSLLTFLHIILDLEDKTTIAQPYQSMAAYTTEAIFHCTVL